jgi:uncharacterized protein YbjT (DUF2867 family)
MKTTPILIIGKNGKTGARVNQRLKDLGYSTRAVSRSTTPSFDWNNPLDWSSVFEGVKSAYVTYQPDLAIPQAEAAIKEFVRVAIDRGVQHIVLLSGRGEQGAERAEKVLQGSGINWNIVRCSWFAQNFSESFMLQGIIDGELVLPANDTVEPFVDADDIADVVVATLTQTTMHNKLYELTGPRALNFADCVNEISQALQRPLRFTPVPIDAYINVLKEQGVPEDMQWLLRELFTEVLDGRNSQVKNGVEQALGRPASDFKTYIQKAIKSAVWENSLQQRTA